MSRNEETHVLTSQGFFEILATGSAPTVDLVNEWMEKNGHAKRNRNAISAALKNCWDSLGKRIQQNTSIDGIPDDMVMMVVTLRDKMLDLARGEFESDTTEIKRQAQIECEEAKAKLLKTEEITAGLRQLVASTEEELNRTRSDFEETSKQREALEKKLAVETERNEQNKRRLEAFTEDLISKNRALSALVEAMQAEHATALKAEAERSATLHRSMLQQVDDAKTGNAKLSKTIEKLEERLITRERESQQRERELADMRAALSAALGEEKGRTNMLQDRVAELLAVIKENNALQELLKTDMAKLQSELEVRAKITNAELEKALSEAFLAGEASITSTMDKKAAKAILSGLNPKRSDDYAMQFLVFNNPAVKIIGKLK